MRRTFDTHGFRITTTSPRRYLVVSIRGQYTVKRTDNRRTAEQVRRQDPTDRTVIDTQEAGR